MGKEPQELLILYPNMINFYLIKSKEAKYFQKSLDSFTKTVKKKYLLNVIDEFETREETLNYIFSINNKQNLVCFSDDVILTEGWLNIIEKNLHSARSIGFSMKKPEEDSSTNYGFDLVNDDGLIRTEARRTNPNGTQANYDLLDCITFTGCFFSLASECFKLVSSVPLEGKNRLGEFLYHILLKRAGGNVLVSPHLLEHYAVSSKSKTDKKNSESFQDELLIWNNAISKFELQNSVNYVIDNQFEKISSSFPKKAAIWGAGSIAKKIIKHYNLDPQFFISGLDEEHGKSFLNKKIFSYKSLKNKKIETILIAVEGYEKTIASLIRNELQNKEIFYTKLTISKETIRHSIEKFS